MTELVLDYSFSRPDPKALKAHCLGVMRYLAPTSVKDPNGKVLTLAEAKALLKAGVRIGLVWESTAKRATEGLAAGKADAIEAARQAKVLGVPTTVPIFFAVDEETPLGTVTPYFQGVNQAKIAHPIGAYGDAQITIGIRRLKLAPYQWQTVAWSKGIIDKSAHLLQTVSKSPVAGCDVNELQHPMPMWGDPPKPAPVKTPAKAQPAKAPVKTTPTKAPPPKAPAPHPAGPPSRAAARAGLLAHLRHLAHQHREHWLHLLHRQR